LCHAGQPRWENKVLGESRSVHFLRLQNVFILQFDFQGYCPLDWELDEG
jgi:hypothetical protein